MLVTRTIAQYSFVEFLKACEETLRGGIGKVTLMGWVVQSAGRDFSLWTQKKWVIKSLHRADEENETTFKLAFRKAGYFTEEG